MPRSVPPLAIPTLGGRPGHVMLHEALTYVRAWIDAGEPASSVAEGASRLFAQIRAVAPGWTFVHLDSPDASHVFCGPTARPIVIRATTPAELWRLSPVGIWPIRPGRAPCAGAFATDDPHYGDPDAVRYL